MLDWLRLIRASGLFTIAANLTASAIAATYSDGNLELGTLGGRLYQGRWPLLWVVLTSVLLYANGMLWNDLADVDRDRRLHPRRPLPSGRVNLVTAYVVGAVLAIAVLLVAGQIEQYGFFAAGIVLCLALLYDFAAKHVAWLGALVMALVRFSHAIFALLLLGPDRFKPTVLTLAAAVGATELESFQPGLLIYPGILGTYVLGLTLVSELESRHGRRWELLVGGGLMLLAIASAAALLFTAHWIRPLQQGRDLLALVGSLLLGLGLLAFLLWRVGAPWLSAVRTGRKALVGPVIGAALGGIILLDALIATAYHPLGGLVIAALYPCFRLVGKAIRMD